MGARGSSLHGVRAACDADAGAICGIYDRYVLHSTVSFEEAPVGLDEMRRRMHAHEPALPWLVMETDRTVVAYAYAVPWKARAAYRYSVESSVYVAPQEQRRGHATRLYGALMERLREQGMHTVIAGIALPNAGSVALHEKLGFVKVAHFQRVGFKFERWLDVGYWQRSLESP